MSRVVRLTGWTVAVLFCLISSAADCQRALVVTTDQYWSPRIATPYGGMYPFADLVGAGLPFDVRTYSRFLSMDMSPYDVIVLTGNTSPVPVADVATRCEQLIAAGKKIFINGHQPFQRFTESGQLVEELYYADRLFGAAKGQYKMVNGIPVMPASLEKDPMITAVGGGYYYLSWFVLQNPAPIQVTIEDCLIAFLGPTGGALRGGGCEYEYNLFDYGKLVNYLRYGDGLIVGFANDRIEGLPVVSWEVHCHVPGGVSARNAVISLAERYGIPLDCLLVLGGINAQTAAWWESVTSPLIAKGSHTRTHPNVWQWVPDVLYETTEALEDQRAMIPSTINFFDFSGDMNPTAAQMDQIYAAGTLFGGNGWHPRKCPTPDGTYIHYQRMPTCQWWVDQMAACEQTPTWPSTSVDADNTAYNQGADFQQVIAEEFQQNVKYGVYTYGIIHDTYADVNATKFVNGVPMCAYIDNTMRWLHDQGVRFIFTHDLIKRSQDYIHGQISYVSNPDGSITVTATRPNALINEIKVGFKGDLAPSASGSSVVSQHLAGECLYITLVPETTSTVQVQWNPCLPVAPVINSSSAYISNASQIGWTEPVHPQGIAEYQYAVGTSPGGTEAQDWTSAGASTSVVLSQAQLTHGGTYYVSVKARYSGSAWSELGISQPLTADLTPPTRPIVTDDGESQLSTSDIHARWTAEDPESHVVGYSYAVGASPGAADVKGWTLTTATEAYVTGLNLTRGMIYYVSVKARNSANLWSEYGSSDGILIQPGPISVGMARGLPNGSSARLSGDIVTAVFTGGFYIESPDKSAGMKVISSESVSEGDVVELYGEVSLSGAERVITPETFQVIGQGSIKPLYMCNRAVGGAGDELVPGVSGASGLNNVGLLVKTSGKITFVGSDYIYMDDGSNLVGSSGRRGIKVWPVDPGNLRVGSIVLATGIITLETNGTTFWPMIHTRRGSDVVVCVY